MSYFKSTLLLIFLTFLVACHSPQPSTRPNQFNLTQVKLDPPQSLPDHSEMATPFCLETVHFTIITSDLTFFESAIENQLFGSHETSQKVLSAINASWPNVNGIQRQRHPIVIGEPLRIDQTQPFTVSETLLSEKCQLESAQMVKAREFAKKQGQQFVIKPETEEEFMEHYQTLLAKRFEGTELGNQYYFKISPHHQLNLAVRSSTLGHIFTNLEAFMIPPEFEIIEESLSTVVEFKALNEWLIVTQKVNRPVPNVSDVWSSKVTAVRLVPPFVK